MLRRFRVHCQDNLLLTVTGDFKIDLAELKNKRFCRLVTAKLSLCVVSDVSAPTTRAGNINLVPTKNIDTRIQCLALPTCFSDHRALVKIVSGILDANHDGNVD